MGVSRSGPADTAMTTVSVSPARFRVLNLLRSREQAWSIQELADTLELHSNTVREHLTALEDARLAYVKESHTNGPGRPANFYTATPLGSGLDYGRMASALAMMIADLPDAAERSFEAGTQWGEQLAADLDSATASRDDFDAIMTQLGFAPTTDSNGNIALHACPVLAVAKQHPNVVCALHAGMLNAVARACGITDEITVVPNGVINGCFVRFDASETAAAQ